MFYVDKDIIEYREQAGSGPGVFINTRKEFETYAAGLTREQLQDLYNTCPGAPPVRRLRNRPYAVERIWHVMQSLIPKGGGAQRQVLAPVGQDQRRNAAPLASTGGAKPKENLGMKALEPFADKVKRKATAKGAPAKKHDLLWGLIARKSGATLDELVEKLGWQKHTIRGSVSTMAKKGASIESTKNSKGERVYRAL